MCSKLCILLGGMLITVSALAAPELAQTGNDGVHLVTINGRPGHSESSRQGTQHSRMVKSLQPGVNLPPVATDKNNKPDNSRKVSE